MRQPFLGALLVALALGCSRPNPAYRIGTAEQDATAVEAARPPVDRPDEPDAPKPPVDVPADVAVPADASMSGDGPPDGRSDAMAGAVADAPAPALFRLVLSGVNVTVQHGGPAGTGHSEDCSDNQALVGYTGIVAVTGGGASVIGSLQGQCGELVITGSGPPVVEVHAGTALPTRGRGVGTAFSAVCPANQVLVSFFGRGGSFLDQLGLQCAPLTITGDAAMKVVIGSPTSLGPFGGMGGTTFSDGCGADQIARGQLLNDGAYVDSLGLACGAPGVAR
jgi:hypothetical protein